MAKKGPSDMVRYHGDRILKGLQGYIGSQFFPSECADFAIKVEVSNPEIRDKVHNYMRRGLSSLDRKHQKVLDRRAEESARMEAELSTPENIGGFVSNILEEGATFFGGCLKVGYDAEGSVSLYLKMQENRGRGVPACIREDVMRGVVERISANGGNGKLQL